MKYLALVLVFQVSAFGMTLSDAKKARESKVEKANQEYVQDLKELLKAAMKAGDLEKANKINSCIQSAGGGHLGVWSIKWTDMNGKEILPYPIVRVFNTNGETIACDGTFNYAFKGNRMHFIRSDGWLKVFVFESDGKMTGVNYSPGTWSNPMNTGDAKPYAKCEGVLIAKLLTE